MKLYLIFSRKNLLITLSAVVLAVIVGSEIYAASATKKNADTEPKRINFIYELGVEVEEPGELRQTSIPESFSDVYENYNEIQKKAGYDLKKYCGKNVEIYTYKVKSEKDSAEYVNLIVYNGMVIGGDISSVAINGSMEPLRRVRICQPMNS